MARMKQGADMTANHTAHQGDPDLLKALINPDIVALIGASNTPGRLTARPQSFLTQHGFQGRILPINPRRDQVQGIPALPSLAAHDAARDGVIDHAYILLDTDGAIAAVEDCARAGVRVVSILADGFAETGAEGQAKQDRIAAIARAANMHVIGPNSTGTAHVPSRFICTSNAAFAARNLPAGGLCVLSQSGSLTGMLLSRGATRGVGFSGFASLGNEAVTDIGTYGQWMLDDPATHCFALFMETVRNPDALERFARAAHDQDKPVVAYVIGRSDEGQDLAVSHTGALSGAAGAISGFLRDIGIVEVPVLDALLDAPLALRRARPDPARPRHATVLTTTGGGGGMILDQINAHGVPIAGCGAQTREGLAHTGISLGSGKLIDVTMAGAKAETMSQVVSALLTDPETGVLVVALGSNAQFSPDQAIAPLLAARDAAPEGAAPMVVMPLPHAPESLGILQENDVAGFANVESCAASVAALFAAAPPLEVPELAVPEGVAMAVTGQEVWDEISAGHVFDALGITGPAQAVLPAGATGRALKQAIDALPLTYPLVVKLVSPDLPHKTEAGAVRVNIPTPEALATAIPDMQAAAEAYCPGYRLTGVLVQEMAKGLGEALIGLTRDPRVGPMITLAAGGIWAEVLRDSTIRRAPISLSTARQMISEIKSFAPLRGYRGQPKGDLEALAHALCAVSQLALIPEITEAEINPILIGPEGQGITRLDALIRTKAPET